MRRGEGARGEGGGGGDVPVTGTILVAKVIAIWGAIVVGAIICHPIRSICRWSNYRRSAGGIVAGAFIVGAIIAGAIVVGANFAEQYAVKAQTSLALLS